MSETLRRRLKLAALLLGGLLSMAHPALAGAPADLESGLNVAIGGVSKTLTLAQHPIGQHRADRSGSPRVRQRLRSGRHARHPVSGRIALEIRRGNRRHA